MSVGVFFLVFTPFSSIFLSCLELLTFFLFCFSVVVSGGGDNGRHPKNAGHLGRDTPTLLELPEVRKASGNIREPLALKTRKRVRVGSV